MADALRATRGEVWPVVIGHFPGTVELDATRVSRLDLARDFKGSSEPGAIIAHHARSEALPKYVRQDPQLWIDRETSRPNYVKVGGKDHVVLYEHEGTLRFEVRARRNWLERHGIIEFSQITTERTELLGKDRWSWFDGGAQVVVMDVGTPEQLIYPQVVRLAKSRGWTRQKRASLLQLALDAAHGYPLSWSQRQHLKEAQGAGLVLPRVAIEPTASQPLVEALDLETGMVATHFAEAVSNPMDDTREARPHG